MSTNPRTLSWTNPTQAVDQTGATVSWPAASDMAGIQIQIDSTPVVTALSGNVSSFDLTTLAPYKALSSGSHSIGLAVTTKEGAVSTFAAAVPFLIALVPLAPSAVVVA